MDVNQFALYQLKNIPENRQIRFRPYSTLQEKGIQIQYKDYTQVYLARMQPGDEPEQFRRRFNEKLPRTFHGHSISVSGEVSGEHCQTLLFFCVLNNREFLCIIKS